MDVSSRTLTQAGSAGGQVTKGFNDMGVYTVGTLVAVNASSGDVLNCTGHL